MKRKLAGLIGREFGRLVVYDGGLMYGKPSVGLAVQGNVLYVQDPDLIALARAVVEAVEPEAERTVEHAVVERLPSGETLRHYCGDLAACRAVVDRFKRNGRAGMWLVEVETTTIMREVEAGEGVEG